MFNTILFKKKKKKKLCAVTNKKQKRYFANARDSEGEKNIRLCVSLR